MDDNVAKKYKVSFTNKILSYKTGEKVLFKIPDTNIEALSMFLLGWPSLNRVEESLLPDIIDALTGVKEEIENGSETVDIFLNKDTVEFYPRSYADFEIPTYDFKEIVEGWRDFLKLPPLNGSKI